MKRKLTIAGIVAALVLSALLVLHLGGTSKFDMIGFGLMCVRMLAWVVGVSFYFPLMAALGDDDLEQDYARINDGNAAVAIYRGAELLIVGATNAVLVSQI